MRLARSATQDEPESEAVECDSTDWRQWCRLCAKQDMEGSVHVFDKCVDSSLPTAIGKYFWVNIKLDDTISKYLCVECYTLITSLVNFTEHVNKVQAMFCLLQNLNTANAENANKIRQQYGLEDSWQHIIKLSTHTEDEVILEQEQENAREQEDTETLPEEDDVNVKKVLGEKSVVEFLTDEEAEAEDEALIATIVEDGVDDLQAQEHEEITFELADDLEKQLKSARSYDSRAKRGSRAPATFKYDEDDVDEEEEEPKKEGKVEEGKDDEEDEEEEELQGEEEEDEEENERLLKLAENSIEIHELKCELEEQIEAHSSSSTTRSSSVRCKVKDNNKQGSPTPPLVLKRKRGRPIKNPDMVALSSNKRNKTDATDADGDTSPGGGNFRYECKFCPRKYKNATSYRKHMTDIHHVVPDIPDFTCDKCPERVFPTENQLAMHVRTHLPLEKKLDIPCPYCEKMFTKIAVMRQHVSGTHHNEKPYVCDQCGRAMKTLAALNEHKLVHTTDCPYECEVCHKSFKNKARLKIHADIHTQTAYMCPQCGLQLNTRRTLKMHMLVHSDEKQFQCNFCGSAFKRSKALKNHLILHTGMRPYKCNFCTKSFSNGSNCRSHKRKMHPKELAAEEAQGKKKEHTAVPNLNELRFSSNYAHNPREVNRTTGGLPKHLRELLLRLEERSNRKDANKATKTEALPDGTILDDGTTIEIHHYEDGSVAEFMGDTVAIDGEIVQNDDEDDDDEGDEGETVIYEIIDEI